MGRRQRVVRGGAPRAAGGLPPPGFGRHVAGDLVSSVRHGAEGEPERGHDHHGHEHPHDWPPGPNGYLASASRPKPLPSYEALTSRSSAFFAGRFETVVTTA